MTPFIRYRPQHGSWHVVRNWTRVPGRAVTLCGRTASGETADTFGDDRTCETCLRINAKARPE